MDIKYSSRGGLRLTVLRVGDSKYKDELEKGSTRSALLCTRCEINSAELGFEIVRICSERGSTRELTASCAGRPEIFKSGIALITTGYCLSQIHCYADDHEHSLRRSCTYPHGKWKKNSKPTTILKGGNTHAHAHAHTGKHHGLARLSPDCLSLLAWLAARLLGHLALRLAVNANACTQMDDTHTHTHTHTHTQASTTVLPGSPLTASPCSLGQLPGC